ncbi:LysR family transcriptional regulator [Oecophyllibacter saccharovorans]|uniref:LysR family transcriptional regulator n=1 Tax=Oecophyllibacter saccharovorans TaxID=2558360 RepID=UPI001142600B|nr:LysR family transcriptional regulator [Oecophyllibacter saccharovorans]QDH15902.1 LysR family transcriptional regulator [Oecophyllibacter saccharovorans]
MDWDKLRIFHTVAEAGSFTHAGDRLNLSQSAVSRQISALEEVLGVPLFHRHARGLILTEQGEVLHQTAREVFAKLAMTQAFLSENRERAVGKIKVTTTTDFGLCWLIPRLHRFLKDHADVNVELLLEDADLDLSMREADVAIRMHPPTQPDLIQRHLASFSMPIYASRAYLQEHGTPRTLKNLEQHALIGFSGPQPPLPHINWLLERLIKEKLVTHPHIPLAVNSVAAIATAIAAGNGIGALPPYTAASYPELVRILPEIRPPQLEAFFVYPEELRSSKRISVFRDFLLAELNDDRHELGENRLAAEEGVLHATH